MASSGYVTYYHYTDRDSANMIMRTRRINQSSGRRGDAAFGPGTYLTQMPPHYAKSLISKNNFDGTTSTFYIMKVNDGKVDVAIKIEILKGRVEDYTDYGRDVHKYPGDLCFDSPDVGGVEAIVVNNITGAVQSFVQ